jgi:hypothetical protein
MHSVPVGRGAQNVLPVEQQRLLKYPRCLLRFTAILAQAVSHLPRKSDGRSRLDAVRYPLCSPRGIRRGSSHWSRRCNKILKRRPNWGPLVDELL